MANMKNLFLGLALLVLSEVHAQDDLKDSCLELIKIGKLNQACCKQRKIWFDGDSQTDSQELETCKNLKNGTKEGLCAYSVCVLEDFGIMKDGKFQDDIIIPKNESNDPFLIGLKRRCLGGENQPNTLINKCESIAILATCMHYNIAVTCDVWDDKENCKKTVATAKKCGEFLDTGFFRVSG